MKAVVMLCLLVAVWAAPSPCSEDSCSSTDDNKAEIISYDNDNKGLGMYKFSFEQTDGTKHQQQGNLINEGSDGEYLSVKGSFTFIGKDGVTYTITYTADENGYKPEIDQGPGGAVPDAVVASMLG